MNELIYAAADTALAALASVDILPGAPPGSVVYQGASGRWFFLFMRAGEKLAGTARMDATIVVLTTKQVRDALARLVPEGA
jgi:hypothetical protein